MNENEVKVSAEEKDKEAYLAAMRQLEQEKKDAKKAKKKKRKKKVLIAFLVIIVGFILFMTVTPMLGAQDSINNLKDYIDNPEAREVSLSYLVNEYVGYDFHSDEKEVKNMYKLGKRALEAEDYETAAYLLKYCITESEDYAEKINKDLGNADEILLKGARAAVESGNYKSAVEFYTVYKGNENIANEIKDAKYNLAIDYVSNKEYIYVYDILEELGDYRYSKELLMWTRVESNKDFDATSTARSALKSRLKDPSSYQENFANNSSIAIVKKAEAGNLMVQIVRYVSINYSATNSFGGRITDTYSWNNNGPSFSAKGFEKQELEDLLKMKSSEIVEKARNYK